MNHMGSPQAQLASTAAVGEEAAEESDEESNEESDDTSRVYRRAYREGKPNSHADVEKLIGKFKSHRSADTFEKHLTLRIPGLYVAT